MSLKINRYLKKSTKPTARMFFKISAGGKSTTFHPGIVVKVKDWDKQRQKLISRTRSPNNDYINNSMDQLESKAKNFYHKYHVTHEHYPSVDEVKMHLTGQAPEKENPFVWMHNYIERSGMRNNPKTGKRIQHRTIQKYRTSLGHLKDMYGSMKWNDFTVAWAKGFVVKLQELDFSMNTINKHLTTVKGLIKAAHEDDVHNCVEYTKRGFTAPREPSQNIYLTIDEVNTIEQLDLSHSSKLERVRDLFIIECWTGLRYSDVEQLPSLDLSGDYFRVTLKKTGIVVTIPILKPSKRILQKYSEKSLPNVISIQKYNEYLKEIGELAKINRPFIKTITKGGKRVDEKKPAYEMISSHTARRSFATNMYILGVPSIDIMQITGHKEESSFMKYIKISSTLSAQRMKEVTDKYLKL